MPLAKFHVENYSERKENGGRPKREPQVFDDVSAINKFGHYRIETSTSIEKP